MMGRYIGYSCEKMSGSIIAALSAEMTDFTPLPEYRGMGIGTALRHCRQQTHLPKPGEHQYVVEYIFRRVKRITIPAVRITDS